MISRNIYKLFTIIFLFAFHKTFSQTDSIICIDVGDNIIQKVSSNAISLETVYTIDPLFNNGYGFGITYERILSGRKSLVATCKIATTKSESIDNSKSNAFSYYQAGIRFYLTNSVKSRKKENNHLVIIKKKDSQLSQPKGGYIGPVLVYESINYNNNKYDPLTSNLIENKQSSLNSLGLGLCLGYQWIIKELIVINIDLPIAIGYEKYSNNWEDADLNNNYQGLTIISMLNINLGITF